MTIEALQSVLPPFCDDQVSIIKGDQTLKDIKKEVLQAHQVFTKHYDCIAHLYCSGSVESIAKRLFKFCQDNLPYEAETNDWQTTRSPAAILAMSQAGYPTDCKHYSGWIAGVLDAINRKHSGSIDWCYRFASYDPNDDAATHVFVVVKDLQGNELWIDPAPIEGSLVTQDRSFNDRYVRPESFTDKKPVMSITRISGIGMMLAPMTIKEGYNEGVQLASGDYFSPVYADGYTNDYIYGGSNYTGQSIEQPPTYEPVVQQEKEISDIPMQPDIVTYRPLPPAEAVTTQTTEVTQPIPRTMETAQVEPDTSTFNLAAWIKANPMQALLIGLVGGYAIYSLTKKK